MRTRFVLMTLVVLSAAAAAGCADMSAMFEPATLYADTRIADKDGFTNRGPQWAYHMEPVTFDFAADLAATDYAVFIWPGGQQDVLLRMDALETLTYFRGVGRFKAGPEPRRNTVQAVAYMNRGERDWYLDNTTGEWTFHPMRSDEADVMVGRADMDIVCYRRDLDIAFQVPSGRRIEGIELRFNKDDGTAVARRLGDEGLTGPLELVSDLGSNTHRVRYTPTWEEVNRTGETPVELIWTLDDGSQGRKTETIDTP